MASEIADKDALPAAVDEVVGASQSSSQSTQASAKNSQDSEAQETTQEAEDAEMPQAAAEPQEDVEMKEAEGSQPAEKSGDDVAATQAAESSNAVESEANTGEDEPVAGNAEATDKDVSTESSKVTVENEEEGEEEPKTVEDEPADSAEAKDVATEFIAVAAEKKVASESKKEDAPAHIAEEKEKDVATEAAAEEKNESKTEEDDPVADGAEEKVVAGTEPAEGDVEMTDVEAEEAKSEDNDAPTEVNEVPVSEKEKPCEGSDAVEESSTTDAVAPESSTNGSASPSRMEVTPTDPKAVEEEEAKKSDQGSTAAGDSPVSSPKRKEPTKVSSEVSNGGAAQVEPVAKKRKVNGTDAKTSENTDADAAKDAVSLPVMISRDDMAKMEEDSGRLKFEVITNDGTDKHLIQLTTLKNIFAKQLPKMPKEYIVRLVFDKNHKSMLILKNGTHVIGGICYRPFEKNHFAEIAFCAINASDQVKGYGTRLMNHLKEYVKTKSITHFLTYADNYAIGYFKKQGFTKSVSMSRPNWYGYIKDYDGGTLMECTIHTQINYLRITSMIHTQRKAIQDKIKERAKSQTVYPGLSKFAEGRLMDIYMVPGVKEAGWSQAVIRNNRIGTRDQGSLKSQLSQLVKGVSNHRSAWPFHEPVDTSVVVDYLDHIKEPIDLQLISKRIDSGAYLSKAALKAELEKMCDNCMLYNTPETNYYKAALDLREFIQSRIQIRDHM